MKIYSIIRHPKTRCLTALLLFWLAIFLTSIGVTGWPILIYAAAPCYFLTFVLVFARRTRKRSDKMNIDQNISAGFFSSE